MNSKKMDTSFDGPFAYRATELSVDILRRKTSKENDPEVLHRMAFEHVKKMENYQCLIKCDTGLIAEEIEEITINHPTMIRDTTLECVKFYVYTNHEHAAEIETIENGKDDGDDVPASHHWILPNREFQGQWEHLFYEEDLKENMLRFVKSIMLFAQKNVDVNAISCNKLLLLHGPPGTGKTSLCKALAQKIAIQMNDKFRYTHLFEINSHSVFSKWFSESGKLVLKLFSSIKEVAEDPNSLVIILIDEVESIAYARNSVSANEPSDSLRVVNAVLTQLDQLRRHTNVLVLTTSNLSGAIDAAFVDRADLKQYVGYPSPLAIFHIFKSAIEELIKVGIIFAELQTDGKWKSNDVLSLLDIAKKSHGLSGRSLRKLPLLAHAWFIGSDEVDMQTFLNALDDAVDKHLGDTIAMAKASK